MKLKDLILNCPEKFCEFEISGVTDDSRKVEKNNLFVCVKGPVVDGHDYAEKAVEEHFTDMQAKFMKTLKYKKNPPFANNTTQEDVDRAMNQAMRQCDRYRMLKKEKKTPEYPRSF